MPDADEEDYEDDVDINDLPDDFCEEAEQQANYEAAIAAEFAMMESEGEDMKARIVGDLVFEARVRAKLRMKGLTPEDVFEAWNYRIRPERPSKSNGAHTVVEGVCESAGKLRIVFKIAADYQSDSSVLYEVVTSHSI